MEIMLYDRELEVMQVLWERGPATVAEVKETLADPMAYTTVLTVLRRLEEKGYVGHAEEGRAHRYHPLIESKQVRESAIDRLTRRMFDGSAAMLLSHLVTNEKLTDAELRRLKKWIAGQLGEES